MVIAALVVFDLKLGPCVERLTDASWFDEDQLHTLAFAAIPEVQPTSLDSILYFRIRVRDDVFLTAVSRYICQEDGKSDRGFSQSALVLLSENELYLESMEKVLAQANSYDDITDNDHYESDLVSSTLFGRSLRPMMNLIWTLHHYVLFNKPIAIYGKDAMTVSRLVVCLTSIIHPLQYHGDWRPLLTLQDRDTMLLCKSTNCIIGFCNPIIIDRLTGDFLVINVDTLSASCLVGVTDEQLLCKLRMIDDDDVLGVVLHNYFARLTQETINKPKECLKESLNYNMHTNH